MSIARTVERYLIQNKIPYDLMSHPYTETSRQSAHVMHVPAEQVAKAVVLEDEIGYLMVVIPSTHYLMLNTIRKYLNRDMQLTNEPQLRQLFRDCVVGAIPPLGPAYGIETLIDKSLTEQPDIYFEAGDHQGILHVSTNRFLELLGFPSQAP